jgi:hypothetical protein
VSELRALFNNEILPKIQAGALLPMVLSQNPPRSDAGQPPGTLSQRVEYVEIIDGRPIRVATVHQYLRPDGTLGGSGLPDPKRVFYDGVVYAAVLPHD